MSMTLEESIRFHTEEAKKMKLHRKVNEIILGTETYEIKLQEHTQTAEWLKELQERRKADNEIPFGDSYSFTELDSIINAYEAHGGYYKEVVELLKELRERRKQPEIIRCKDCKHWKQQTNYKGVLLSFGFCESDDMWRSLYGETYDVSHIDTDDDFYCGYAERRTDE